MVTAVCVAVTEASPSCLPCCGVGGDGGFGIGGVRGTPTTAEVGSGGLERETGGS